MMQEEMVSRHFSRGLQHDGVTSIAGQDTVDLVLDLMVVWLQTMDGHFLPDRPNWYVHSKQLARVSATRTPRLNAPTSHSMELFLRI